MTTPAKNQIAYFTPGSIQQCMQQTVIFLNPFKLNGKTYPSGQQGFCYSVAVVGGQVYIGVPPPSGFNHTTGIPKGTNGAWFPLNQAVSLYGMRVVGGTGTGSAPGGNDHFTFVGPI